MSRFKSVYKKSSLWLIILLSTAFLLRLSIALSPVESSFRLSVPDDAYYDFTIARNLVAGYGATADRLAPTNGFQPLWVIAIVPFWIVAQSPTTWAVHLALAACALLSTLAALVLYVLVRRNISNPWLALFAPAIYLLNPFGLLLGVDGLETSLAIFLFGTSLLISWKVIDHPESKLREWLAAGLLWGLLLIARTDFVIITLGIVFQTLWHYRHMLREMKARLGAWLGGASVPLAPWIVWNLLTFGTIVQVSGQTYPFYQHTIWLAEHGADLGALLAQEANLFFDFALRLSRWLGLGRWMLLPAILFVGTVVWRLAPGQRKKIGARLAIPTLFAGFTLLYHVLYRWIFQPWYQAAFAYLVALWLTVALAGLWLASQKRAFAVALIMIGGLYLNAGWDLVRAGGIYPQQIEDAHRDFCGGLERIGESDSGFSMYFAPCSVVNLDGVVNNQVFDAIENKSFRQYLESTHIQRIALNPIVSHVVELGEGAIPVFPPWR